MKRHARFPGIDALCTVRRPGYRDSQSAERAYGGVHTIVGSAVQVKQPHSDLEVLLPGG